MGGVVETRPRRSGGKTQAEGIGIRNVDGFVSSLERKETGSQSFIRKLVSKLGRKETDSQKGFLNQSGVGDFSAGKIDMHTEEGVGEE